MKYSLIIHVNGLHHKDCTVYLTNGHQDSETWWVCGRLQGVHFQASADYCLPIISGTFIGFGIGECSKPDLSSGINILLSDFAFINEQGSIPQILVRKNEKPLGFIQEINVDFDVNGCSKFYIEVPRIVDWLHDVPSWVEIGIKLERYK